MINQVVLVGRIANKLRTIEAENGRKYSKMTLAVPRNFKNPDGEYDTDFIDCVLWGNVAENTKEWCNVGDMIGIKGRLQTKVIEKEIENSDYNKIEKIIEVVAEKVTFLSSKKNEKESEVKE